MYEEGRQVEKNNLEAAKWYRQAAEQGNADAQYKIGTMYELGKGVKTDKAEAIKWYEKASKQGQTDASAAWARLFAEELAKKDPFEQEYGELIKLCKTPVSSESNEAAINDLDDRIEKLRAFINKWEGDKNLNDDKRERLNKVRTLLKKQQEQRDFYL